MENLVEVSLKNPDDFLKVKETLTRIGIASADESTLTQTCHILHKRGKYFIVHFKELFALDGKYSTFSDDDRARRDAIARLLDQWGLVELVTDIPKSTSSIPIKVIPYSSKNKWVLVSKYTIGNK